MYSDCCRSYSLKSKEEEIKSILGSASVEKNSRLNDIRTKDLLYKMLTDPRNLDLALVSTTLDEIYNDLYIKSLTESNMFR